MSKKCLRRRFCVIKITVMITLNPRQLYKDGSALKTIKGGEEPIATDEGVDDDVKVARGGCWGHLAFLNY